MDIEIRTMNPPTISTETEHHTPLPRPSSALLQLPAELRNAIWEHAVFEPELTITVVEDGILPEPPLLSTSKAIRAEALSIYYGSHGFHLSSWAFSTANIRLWQRKEAQLPPDLRVKVVVFGFLAHSSACPDWPEFKEWLCHIHSCKRLVGSRPEPLSGELREVICALFELLRAARSMAWSVVEARL